MQVLRQTHVSLQELKDSIPLDPCIQNYDSGYHIIFTNVKTIQQSNRPMRGGQRTLDGAVNTSWPAFSAGDRLAGNQYQSAANFAVADLLKDFVDLFQGTRRDLAANPSSGRHGQHFAHILSRSDRGRLDVHLRCRHLNGLKTNGLGR